jgi:phage-related holin
MIIYNIKSFLTVTGFFIGLLFSVIMAVPPIELVIDTILFTMGFYSFANLSLAFYIKNLEVNVAENFPKKSIETELDKLIKDLDKKEDKFMPQKENFQIIIDKQIDKIEESQK